MQSQNFHQAPIQKFTIKELFALVHSKQGKQYRRDLRWTDGMGFGTWGERGNRGNGGNGMGKEGQGGGRGSVGVGVGSQRVGNEGDKRNCLSVSSPFYKRLPKSTNNSIIRNQHYRYKMPTPPPKYPNFLKKSKPTQSHTRTTHKNPLPSLSSSPSSPSSSPSPSPSSPSPSSFPSSPSLSCSPQPHKHKYLHKDQTRGKCLLGCGFFSIKCDRCKEKLDCYNRKFQEFLRRRGIWDKGRIRLGVMDMNGGLEFKWDGKIDQNKIKSFITSKLLALYQPLLQSFQLPKPSPSPQTPKNSNHNPNPNHSQLHLHLRLQQLKTTLHKNSQKILQILQEYINGLNLREKQKIQLYRWSEEVNRIFGREIVRRTERRYKGMGKRGRKGRRREDGQGQGEGIGEDGDLGELDLLKKISRNMGGRYSSQFYESGQEWKERLSKDPSKLTFKLKPRPNKNPDQRKTQNQPNSNQTPSSHTFHTFHTKTTLPHAAPTTATTMTTSFKNLHRFPRKQKLSNSSNFSPENQIDYQISDSNKNKDKDKDKDNDGSKINSNSNKIVNIQPKRSKIYKRGNSSSFRNSVQGKGNGVVGVTGKANWEQGVMMNKRNKMKRMNPGKDKQKEIESKQRERSKTKQKQAEKQKNKQKEIKKQTQKFISQKQMKPNPQPQQTFINFPQQFQQLCGKYRLKHHEKKPRPRRFGIIHKTVPNILPEQQEFNQFKKQIQRNKKLQSNVQKILKKIDCESTIINSQEPMLNINRKVHFLKDIISSNQNQNVRNTLQFYVKIFKRNYEMGDKYRLRHRKEDVVDAGDGDDDIGLIQQNNEDNKMTISEFLTKNRKKFLQNQKLLIFQLQKQRPDDYLECYNQEQQQQKFFKALKTHNKLPQKGESCLRKQFILERIDMGDKNRGKREGKVDSCRRYDFRRREGEAGGLGQIDF